MHFLHYFSCFSIVFTQSLRRLGAAAFALRWRESLRAPRKGAVRKDSRKDYEVFAHDLEEVVAQRPRAKTAQGGGPPQALAAP